MERRSGGGAARGRALEGGLGRQRNLAPTGPVQPASRRIQPKRPGNCVLHRPMHAARCRMCCCGRPGTALAGASRLMLQPAPLTLTMIRSSLPAPPPLISASCSMARGPRGGAGGANAGGRPARPNLRFRVTAQRINIYLFRARTRSRDAHSPEPRSPALQRSPRYSLTAAHASLPGQ